MNGPIDSSSLPQMVKFVSRGGEKLDFALEAFQIAVTDLVCADLGSHVGGFVDCLLQRGAARVYSVDTSYGTLAWKLRKDPRVVVLERTNAMHVRLPEAVDLATIDVGWTPQRKIVPHAATLVKPGGVLLTLVKPHYEADASALVDGVLADLAGANLLEQIISELSALGLEIRERIVSPIRGHGGNQEFFLCMVRPV